jgi:HlyD family secretion protein
MGKKTLFARTATERKDLDVVQVIIEMSGEFHPPVGLEVDVSIDVKDAATPTAAPRAWGLSSSSS